ncbi:MAG: hypothetical protein V1767_01365 [Chloroflexota bacterium]
MDFERDEFELDLPPEFCQYRDEGCEVATSCLRCPLPAAEMTTGRKVAVVFFDEHNAKEAVVVGVWG